jgi:hypothetical protein
MELGISNSFLYNIYIFSLSLSLSLSLSDSERMTFSVFLLEGTELKADVTMEGPFADLGTEQDMTLFMQKANDFNSETKAPDILNARQVVDFESTNDDIPPPEIPISNDRDQIMMLYENAKRRRERTENSREDGEPFQITRTAPSGGWYRACVVARYSSVRAEIELRKESELDGMEGEHVQTYEARQLQAEQEIYASEGTTIDPDSVVTDQDVMLTEDKMKKLRERISELQSLMKRQRRRVAIHKEVNQHSHQRMVRASIIESLIFVLITFYQVYLIRKWFYGNSLLGR